MLVKEKDLFMLFHTSIRNVFLITSVSMGILGYSRFYRTKGNDLYNLAFIIISTIFMGVSIFIANHIHTDIQAYMIEDGLDETSRVHKLLIIPKMVEVINIIILLFGIYTFKRQYDKNM